MGKCSTGYLLVVSTLLKLLDCFIFSVGTIARDFVKNAEKEDRSNFSHVRSFSFVHFASCLTFSFATAKGLFGLHVSPMKFSLIVLNASSAERCAILCKL